MFAFASGLITMGFFAVSLFFVRFWQRSGDALFAAFAAAFFLLAVNQALLVFSDVVTEEQSWLYLLRLTAFALIIWAVWQKNRKR